MLTILIRDNVISDHISSISSDMMYRGVIQIAIIVLCDNYRIFSINSSV